MQYPISNLVLKLFVGIVCLPLIAPAACAQAQRSGNTPIAAKAVVGKAPGSVLTPAKQPAGKAAGVKPVGKDQTDRLALPPTSAKKAPWDLEMDAGQDVWNTVGKRATANGGWDQAEYDRAMAEVEEHYRRAFDLAKQGSLTDQSRAWYQLGRVLFYQKRYAESFDYYTSALNLRKQADPADTLDVGDIYEQLAMCKGMIEDNQASYDYALKAYRIYSKLLPKDDNKFQYVVRTLGQFCASPAEAIAYKRQEAECTKKNYAKYPGLIACSVFMVAIEQGNAGLLDEALQTAAEAASYAAQEPGDRYGEFIEWNVKHWRRQKAGVEAPWDVIYEPRYAGRRPRVKKVDHPNPPTVAMLDGSDAGRVRSEGETDKPLRPATPHKPSVPPVVSETTASQPPSSQAPKQKPPVSGSGHRYYFQGREVSEEEYTAVKLSNDACDFIRQHRFQQASEQLQKALSLMPDLPFAHANLGIAMNKLGLRTGAIEHLQRAVQLEPDSAAPLGMLASTYQGNGQLDEAIATYRAYVEKFPRENDASVVKVLADDLEKERNKQRRAEATGKSESDYLQYVTIEGKLRWANNRIPVKIFVASEHNVHGYRSEFSEIMHKCFDDWAKSGGPAVTFVSSKKDSDIDCIFTDNFSAVSSPAEGGEAQMRFVGQNFTHSTIVIMTVHATDSLDLTGSEVRAVCLHEIGHSMGLHGHSPRPEDIMFCTIPDTELKPPDLTERDKNTMKLIYR